MRPVKKSLAVCAPELRVRRNYPYNGNADGLTAHLRKRFAQSTYVGIELEINQGIVSAGARRWTALRRVLIESFRAASAPSHTQLTDTGEQYCAFTSASRWSTTAHSPPR